ncbi:protein O-mannosyl-transferase family [Bacteroidota bacterium]
MNSFRKYNLILGWLSFLIALIVYSLTVEPSVSLWDCGEFIASSFKLQIGHPPGAPLYMIIGRVFALFANDTANVARMYNMVSAFSSAFTILFLFWTISHLLKKIFIKSENDHSLTNFILVLGSSMVGALAYTFSDTFWFSAVEAEVYATSSLFTAVVFWAILKWENIADEPHANRWLILIAYLIGLSIGIHLLNLLAIPAIVLVYYFRKYTVSRKGIIYAIVVAVIILGSLMYIIIPGLVKIATWFELLFTNSFGFHYNTGLIVYIFLLLGLLGFGIYRTHFKKQNVVLNTILVSLTVIIIGYSSYALIIIRSTAEPPMNENRPDNAFALLSYLNREQYGDRPLVTGNQYNAEVEDIVYTKPLYDLNKETNEYEITSRKAEIKYREAKILFPRMYSRDNQHKQAYYQFASIKDRQNPTYLDNIEFFFRYQVGHMYLRYFMWNFAGRQDDEQSHGGILHGNWISGIKAIDKARLGNQDELTDDQLNHPARNTYYLIPLILGIIGLLFHLKHHLKDFWIIMFLFILTGIAIVVYLNQHPLQPRERDYAYAGSFYAFSIWVGMGVAGLAVLLKRWISLRLAAIFSFIIGFLGAPLLMATQNWDDHDRSGRYLARDIAKNYLESCDENAILYTVGDNDTFPLWYAQEVEGVRTDIRVVNMMLFNTEWHIDQMKMKAYKSEPLPISLPHAKYRDGVNNSIYVRENERWATVDYISNYIISDDPRTKLTLRNGENVDYIPTHKIVIEVDSAAVIEKGIVKPENAGEIVDDIRIQLSPNNQIMKGNMAQLDIYAGNDWTRPIYYTAGGFDGSLGLEPYYQLDGMAYKVVPIRTPQESILVMGRIDPNKMYDIVMNKFSWGRMNEDDVNLDYYSIRTLTVIRFRNLHVRLALELLEIDEKEKAIEVLDRCMELAPHHVLPFDRFIAGLTFPQRNGETVHHEGIIEAYFMCGETDKAISVLKEYFDILNQQLNYFNSLLPKDRKTVEQDLYEALAQIEELRMLAQQYKQTDLILELGM